MFPIVLIGLVLGGLMYGARGARGTGARSGSRASRQAATLNPRTERPWCEMQPQDFDASDLRNRAGLERWSRCSTTTAEQVTLVSAMLNEALDSAPSDGEALAYAQTRDALERAYRESHR